MMNEVEIKELLKKRNLKATGTRLDLLLKMQKHGSAISHSSIQKQMNPINRVTLYRTINTLKDKGIIHEAFQEKNEIYYAICGTNCEEHCHHHEHIHFKCLKCEEISCKDLDQHFNISIPNHEIHNISVQVDGVCDECYAY